MRLWLVTGAMTKGTDVQMMSYTLEYATENEALGFATQHAMGEHPAHGARSFRAFDITDQARKFCEAFPK